MSAGTIAKTFVLVCGLLVLAALSARGQTVMEAVPVTDERLIEIPAPSRYPVLLVVHGHLGENERSGDVALRVDGRPFGNLSTFVTGPTTFTSWIPIERPAQPTSLHRLKLLPSGSGLVVGPVTVLRAGYVDVDVIDAQTRRPTPAWVRIAAISTLAPPNFGRGVVPGLLEDSVLCPRGTQRVVLPADLKITLIAGQDPFGATQRRLVLPSSTAPIGARFLLTPSLLSEGTLVQAPTLTTPLLPLAQHLALDSLLRIEQRLAGFEVVEKEVIARDPDTFVARLLQDGKPILVDGSTPGRALPDHHRILRTVRRPAHGTLHSNGPILWCEKLQRYRGGPRPVFGEISLRLPCAVEGGRVEIRTSNRVLLRASTSKDTVLTLEEDLPAHSLVAVSFVADGFVDEPLLGPRPMAFLLFHVP